MMSLSDRWLLFRIAVLLTTLRLALLMLPYRLVRRVLATLAHFLRRTAVDAQREADRVGWAIQFVAQRVRWLRPCLLQALAAQFLLQRRGILAKLQIGVFKEPSGHLKAHAWVESAGRVVVGGTEDQIRQFTLLPIDSEPASPITQ